MARIKGGLNAKKKHNRTLKLAVRTDQYIPGNYFATDCFFTVLFHSAVLFIQQILP